MFRLHWPGSRLARRPGPAATHFGNRCFQKSRPVGQAEAGLSGKDTIDIQSRSNQPFFASWPSSRSYSTHPDNCTIWIWCYQRRIPTRSRWLDVCGRPVLFFSSSALAGQRRSGRPMRLLHVKCPNLHVGAAVSTAAHTYICLLATPSGCIGASSRHLVLRSAGEPPSAARSVLCNNWFHRRRRHTASQAVNIQGVVQGVQPE